MLSLRRPTLRRRCDFIDHEPPLLVFTILNHSPYPPSDVFFVLPETRKSTKGAQRRDLMSNMHLPQPPRPYDVRDVRHAAAEACRATARLPTGPRKVGPSISPDVATT